MEDGFVVDQKWCLPNPGYWPQVPLGRLVRKVLAGSWAVFTGPTLTATHPAPFSDLWDWELI